jgi:hypothetical protein
MAVYCISYDLRSSNYEGLINAIKSYGLWWHQTESTWFVDSNQNSKQILDNLRNYIKSGDKIIVIRVQRDWWAVGHTEDEYILKAWRH